MVEAVWHGVFMVLGWSVNDGFIQRQYAPNHPYSHQISAGFLSELNHRAIQLPDNERSRSFSRYVILFCVSFTDHTTVQGRLVYSGCLKYAGKVISSEATAG